MIFKRSTDIDKKDRSFKYENGRFYFTKETERKVFFFLTIFMLVLGIIFYFTGI